MTKKQSRTTLSTAWYMPGAPWAISISPSLLWVSGFPTFRHPLVAHNPGAKPQRVGGPAPLITMSLWLNLQSVKKVKGPVLFSRPVPSILPPGRCLTPRLAPHGSHVPRSRRPRRFPEPCQPLDRPFGDPADLGDESPGKLRGTPFGGLSSTVAEPLALSPLPLHPSQLGPSSSGNTVDGPSGPNLPCRPVATRRAAPARTPSIGAELDTHDLIGDWIGRSAVGRWTEEVGYSI